MLFGIGLNFWTLPYLRHIILEVISELQTKLWCDWV